MHNLTKFQLENERGEKRAKKGCTILLSAFSFSVLRFSSILYEFEFENLIKKEKKSIKHGHFFCEHRQIRPRFKQIYQKFNLA